MLPVILILSMGALVAYWAWNREEEAPPVLDHSPHAGSLPEPSAGILIVGPEGHVRSANAAAERLLGYGRGELAGRDAEKLLERHHNVTWSKRPAMSNKASIVFVEEAELPRMPEPAALPDTAELDASSISLLENELLLVTGLGEVALGNLPPEDALREDLERLTRAAGRAALLCREAAAPKPVSVISIPLNSYVAEIERRLRSLVEPEVEIAVRIDPGAGTASASPALLEQALLSLVLHTLPAIPEPRIVEVATTAGSRIEISIARTGGQTGWRRVLDERTLPRAAAWLAVQGAMLEEDIAEGGAGRRFRVHLAPVHDAVNVLA
jgi:hypothetical protein